MKRLILQTRAHDMDAARALLREAQRHDDPSALIEALAVLPPAPQHWLVLCKALDRVDASQIDAIVTQANPLVERWPAALRYAPPAWRRKGEPRLTLCGALDGLYYCDGYQAHNYKFIRFYPDGVAMAATVYSEDDPFEELVSSVLAWLHRDTESRYQFLGSYELEGGSLHFTDQADRGRILYEGDFDTEGRFAAHVFSEITYHRSELAFAPLGPAETLVDNMFDLNVISAAELWSVKHIGPKRAALIVEDREKNGPFPSVEALCRVPGIGAARLALLRPRFYVRAGVYV